MKQNTMMSIWSFDLVGRKREQKKKHTKQGVVWNAILFIPVLVHSMNWSFSTIYFMIAVITFQVSVAFTMVQ